MSDVERDPFLSPPGRLGGVPTGMVHGGTKTYDELLGEHLARRFGALPSLAPHEVVEAIYPKPFGASVGGGGLLFGLDYVPCGPVYLPERGPMPLTPEQEAYIAKVRETVHGEWAVIRAREDLERAHRQAEARRLIRSRGPIVLEGVALAGEYDDPLTIGDEPLEPLLFCTDPSERRGDQTWIRDVGRVRVTVEFLEEEATDGA